MCDQHWRKRSRILERFDFGQIFVQLSVADMLHSYVQTDIRNLHCIQDATNNHVKRFCPLIIMIFVIITMKLLKLKPSRLLKLIQMSKIQMR